MTDTITTPETPADGSSRRDFLRRSAIVGGTLVWAAPTVQSMAPAAFAQETTKSPKDFSYLVLCLNCSGGNTAECCVKFDLNDNGTVSEISVGGNFSVPGCEEEFTENHGPEGCVDPGIFTVTPLDGAQRVQVSVSTDSGCMILDGTAFGKCGNPNNANSGGACVPAESNTGTTAIFDMCMAT